MELLALASRYRMCQPILMTCDQAIGIAVKNIDGVPRLVQTVNPLKHAIRFEAGNDLRDGISNAYRGRINAKVGIGGCFVGV